MKRPFVLGIIPARGGSKSIPKKNITPLLGKPLIYYTIREAKKSMLLSECIVSTDSQEIAEVAKKYGAHVPFIRPKNLSGDKTPDLPVFKHALTWFKKKHGFLPDIVINLRPTAPLRTSKDIDAVIRLMITTGCDSVRTISVPPYSPFKMWRVKEDGKMLPLLRTKYFKKIGTDVPRQKLPQNIFWQNAMVDATRPSFIMKGKMYGPDIRGYKIDPARAIDIDSLEDLKRAALLLKRP